MEEGEGILRLAPNWVPRSFCKPGRRLRLHPSDYYALGTHRGGIDERWFASTTEAMNENRAPAEGLSYVVNGDQRFTLKDAVAAEGPRLIGRKLWDEFHRWPVYSKFFDNLEPLPHHLHQNDPQAKLVNQQGKPESYYFSPQYNPVGNRFPHTYFGLEHRGGRAGWKAQRTRPIHDPLWGNDRGRAFYILRSRRAGRNFREHLAEGTTGGAALLRSQCQSRRSGGGGL